MGARRKRGPPPALKNIPSVAGWRRLASFLGPEEEQWGSILLLALGVGVLSGASAVVPLIEQQELFGFILLGRKAPAALSGEPPLIEQQELFGFILLGRKKTGKPYTKPDSEILELLGERSAVALKSIELYRDSIEKEKLEEEIHLASEIQRRLLPPAPPPLRNATLLAMLKNSREVGGDLYDFVEFSPGKIGIAVSDVSGKGIPASMLMTTLQASFRAEVEQIRGVDSGWVLNSLLEKGLIKILGRKEVAGRPLVYGTGSRFLEVFGLMNLGGLPTLKELDELRGEEGEEPQSEKTEDESEGETDQGPEEEGEE